MTAQKEVKVTNVTGLHARPASLFVQKAKKYQADIRIKKGDRQINAKSILEVMGLGIDKGNKIIIKASGDKEKEAVETLANFIENELPHSDKEE